MGVHRIFEFDTWRPKYGSASVKVLVAGTTTLASLFTDENLNVATTNPQVLLSLIQNGIDYGKFAAPVYTSSPYELQIDGVDNTGIERPPLTDLIGVVADKATVKTTGGSATRNLDDRFADVIQALDHGALGAVSATNTATLTAAIGIAATAGGGRVFIPSGTYAISALTISAKVILTGAGRGVTILTSTTAGNVITLSGDGAGVGNLTLDGISLVAGSVGVFAKAQDETVFDNAEVKRFETGISFKGGRRMAWRDLYIENCVNGAILAGDNDAGGGADGDQFRDNMWVGGLVQLCTTVGIRLTYVDKVCVNNSLIDVGIKNNTGTGLDINGALYTSLIGSWYFGNTTTIAIDDDSSGDDNGKVVGVYHQDCAIEGGAATFKNTIQDVIFDRCEIRDLDITLTTPDNVVLCRDCTEDALVTIAGEATKWSRIRSINRGAVSGLTTDAGATKGWSIQLAPGQVAYLEAKVIANQRNGTDVAEYHFSVSAERPGSTLAYDAQTANFTLGDILTGATSGATARIIADADSGATGTLTLRDITGVFIDDEIITDVAGGSAAVNGTLTSVNAALLGSVNAIRAAREDDVTWNATFAVNGVDVEVQITGAAAKTVEWLIHVDAVLS